ncbi:hypothetical protein FQA39_LY01228 [Lamprigera yunnana]|nr:hypothetical protein FQA39_LY01228 [Lamprigera yunnana]
MMILVNTQYRIVLVFISTLINLSSSYKTMTVDDHKLCSPVTTRKIRLETELLSALKISIGRLKEHSWQWEKNFHCTFKVQTFQSNLGLFIVIQNIAFRKNFTTNECIDYIQYRRSDGTVSKKYCDTMQAALGMDQFDETELTPTSNSFIDQTGSVEVTVHISREPLVFYEMELDVVFTTYSYCYIPKATNRACNAEYKEYCIYKGFFGDGVINCPYPECVDEGGCSNKVTDQRSSLGNKVVIGSVTTLFTLFVLFICCIWLCRKYKKLCWADHFATPSSANQNARDAVLNEDSLHSISMPSTARVVLSSTATNLTPEEDKDLPPSYEISDKKFYVTESQSYQEIRIPVPWGHIAGKWWGSQEVRPFLTVHGWQENCGSFDLLLPLLNPKLSFLAIDLPGHGLSSPMPVSGVYHWIDYVIALRRIIQYFHWTKISLFGHSLGAMTCYNYAYLFKDSVDRIICIDALKPIASKMNELRRKDKDVDVCLKYEENSKNSCSTYEELVERLHIASERSINRGCCKYILERNVNTCEEEPHKYLYSLDLLTRIAPVIASDNTQIIENCGRVQCPILLLRATQQLKLLKSYYEMEDLIARIKNTNKDFVLQIVDGTHHMHLNNPESLVDFINNFVEKYNCSNNLVDTCIMPKFVEKIPTKFI